MNDPLERFRKSPPLTSSSPPAAKESDEYLAFAAKDRVERLKIKRTNDPTRAPGYAYLLDIAYDGNHGTNFVLVYTFLMVLVRGKNLQPVIMALLAGTADYIQEFDPERWQKPADANAALIESIEVVVQDSGPSISAADKPTL